MNSLYNDIKSIEIPIKILPKNEDYKRGHCLYKLEGYMQTKYVIYDEPLDGFNENSDIYKFGKNIMKKFNIDPDQYTLVYCNNVDWLSYFQLKEIKKDLF